MYLIGLSLIIFKKKLLPSNCEKSLTLIIVNFWVSYIYREREREAIVGDRIDEDKVGYETPCPTILKNFGWSSHDGGCHHMVWMELLMLTKFSFCQKPYCISMIH